MSRRQDQIRFEVTLTPRQRDLLVILRGAQPELSALSVSNDPTCALSAVIDAFDAVWDAKVADGSTDA